MIVVWLALVIFALGLPNDTAEFGVGPFLSVPLELPVAILLMALAPSVLGPVVRFGAALGLALLTVIKLADMAAIQALGRPFSPILDFHLLGAAWNLISGAIGTPGAWLLVVALVGVLIAIACLSFFAIDALERLARRRRSIAAGFCAAVIALGLSIPAVYPNNRSADFTSSKSTDLMVRHAQAFTTSLRDLEDFERQARVDVAAAIPSDVLFSRLKDKDVLLVFIESYGRTVLSNPLYRPHVEPVLREFDRVVEEKGYAAASGYLTSPVAGGQSWLGHASVLSGLWVDNQRRYNALVVSERATLIDDFDRAGWRTVAVMPAITMAWPEGEAFGYDAIYDEDALGYEGLPFNWVTMPDQYTLSAFDRLERERKDRPPIFAEIALISSHAPWTPIPELIDWESIGDGHVFDSQARSGDTPKEVWSDPDRVRLQFRLSIEYALANLSSYVEERLDDDFVMVVLGDHQPSRMLTGETENRDVPYHVISDDMALVGEFRRRWGLADGMLPSPQGQAVAMNAFRERFVRAASGIEAEEAPLPPAADGEPLGPT
ncbi:sulfatase-like hydrolase/transferase [Pararhizobium haloflavum]|uniref:sulfatase-like hydrolase/transferase n=1 Tax=Pararhizobium haloflavum TaxID=2037914 RepID=UPI000C18D676|nr:sulfatase-like hydrolase/transferase [Pararhizobium haloflavum]